LKTRNGKVSLFTATAIVVANMIGTGVFTSLGFQVEKLPSPFTLVLLWFVGGIVALCGALCYAELAAAMPRSGGEYHFLSRIFHPAVGFLAGWTSATVGFAAPVALAAMAFGTYFKVIVPLSPLGTSLGIVWAVSFIHLRNLNLGSTFQNGWTVLKIALILGFIASGLLLGQRSGISFQPGFHDLQNTGSSAFAISLVYVMYSYSGWNASTYIASEIDDPQRNIPRSLLIGTFLVTGLYVALNAIFLFTTPLPLLSGRLEVGLIAGESIFGITGSRLVSGLICLGLISSISAMAWIGPRVAMVMGEDFGALRVFAVKTRSGIPAVAIAFQLAVTTLLLLTSTFESVLIYIQLSLIFCSFLTVLGVIVLRFGQPDLERPYRTWGYPITPLIFLIVSLFMMLYIFREHPLQSMVGLGMMCVGLLLYFAASKPQQYIASK
jgi:APA family basic amino acid/polyamine antiporter